MWNLKFESWKLSTRYVTHCQLSQTLESRHLAPQHNLKWIAMLNRCLKFVFIFTGWIFCPNTVDTIGQCWTSRSHCSAKFGSRWSLYGLVTYQSLPERTWRSKGQNSCPHSLRSRQCPLHELYERFFHSTKTWCSYWLLCFRTGFWSSTTRIWHHWYECLLVLKYDENVSACETKLIWTFYVSLIWKNSVGLMKLFWIFGC